MTAQPANNILSERRFEEFSLKKAILGIFTMFRYLLSKWWVLLLFGLAAGLLFVALNAGKKTEYTANLSFALDDGAAKSTAPNSVSALAQELGFSPAYDAGGVFSSLNNIMELMRSRLIIETTIKRSVSINGKPVLFADFFLDSLEYREKWMSGSPFEKLNFLNSKPGKEEEIFKNSLINNIQNIIVNKLLKVDKKGKNSTLIEASITSTNEAFSKYFLEALIEEVSRYYISIKTQRSKTHLEFIQKRADSVKGAFGGALYSKAAFTDANINVVREVALVPNERRQTDVQLLRETYMNLIRSQEAAKTTLMEETPLFQYLDTPVFPLQKSSSGLLFKFILFFIAGVFITAVFLIIRKLIRSVLAEGNEQEDEEEALSYSY